jgi:hypothetical protein
MCRFNIPVILFFIILPWSRITGVVPDLVVAVTKNIIQQDTLKENQVLYNGKIWRNLYFRVNENQFLFSNNYLQGSITIGGESFEDINLKYDIFKDELLTPADTGGMLQLNKEMVDSFSVSFQSNNYRFIRIKRDSLNGPAGYFNVLYKGKTCLCLKYVKKIDKLTDEGPFGKFYQFSKLYFLKDNVFFPISGERDLINVMSDKRALIKNFISKNNVRISGKVPESFIPVIRYYESIRQ